MLQRPVKPTHTRYPAQLYSVGFMSGAVMPDGAIYIHGMDLSRYGIVRDRDDSQQDR